MNALLHYSLNNEEMSRLNPTAKFVPYNRIHEYKNIDELLGSGNMAFILYLIKSDHYGHWTCLYKTNSYKGVNTPTLVYFNSYGVKPDYDERFVPDTLANKVFEYEPFLFNLIEASPYPCYYNTHRLQGEGTSVCGDWASYRLINRHQTNDQFAKCMEQTAKSMGLSLDETVACIVHNLLSKK